MMFHKNGAKAIMSRNFMPAARLNQTSLSFTISLMNNEFPPNVTVWD